jgi:hypothetical protein
MTSLHESYQAERRAQSGSLIYQPVKAQPAPVKIYDNTPPKTLADYASAPVRSKFQQEPGESDTNFTKRLERAGLVHLTENLPAAELEVVSAEYNAAFQRLQGGQTHADLRAHLDSRQSGTGIGLVGASTPLQRAQALGSRFGTRDVQGNGHLGAQVLTTPGQPSLSMLSRLPHKDLPIMPQRTADQVAQLRSSGAGILGVDR